MNVDEPRARIGYRGAAVSRAKNLALKVLLFFGGALTLVSAFVLSLVFVAIGFTFVLAVGGYLWWKTREMRRQMRARMQGQSDPPFGDDVIEGDVIEGEVISPERTRSR